MRQRVVIADSSDPNGVVNVTNGSLNVNVESSGGIPFSAVSRSNGGAKPTPRAGNDATVRLPPDSTGKALDMSELIVSGTDVLRQRIVLADGTDTSGFVTVTNNALNVNIQGLAGVPLNIGSPNDGDVLTYNATTGRWVTSAPATPAPTFNYSDAEILAGSGNSFALQSPPNPVTSLQLFRSDGVLLRLNIDYHVNGTVVTTIPTFPAGELTAWYRYTGTAPPPPTLKLTWVSVNPTSVAGGDSSTGTVILSGAAPTGGVVVSLSSSNPSVVSVSPTVSVPANVPTVTFPITTYAVGTDTVVTITATYGGAVQTATLTVIAPQVTSVVLSPTSVQGGSPSTGTVTLNGPAPVGGVLVALASSNPVATVPSSVTVLAGSTTATFTVNTTAVAANTALTISATFGATQNAILTVTAPPVVTVTNISPASGTTAGGTAVTIAGTNFTAPATVTIGGTAATNVTVVSGTTITATTPAHAYGVATVAVTSGGQTVSLTNAFTYIAPTPTFGSISPTTGTTAGGTAVTITGNNFASGATVTFGGTAATNVVVVSATSITATTPAHAAGAVTVAITANGQTGSFTNVYTYIAPPTVTAISPTSGTTAGGTAVTITGTNFVAGATVTIGGNAATNVVIANSTTITAVTPVHAAGATDVAVTVSGLTGTLTGAYTYIAPPSAPTVTSVTPNSGPVAGGTAVTIAGTNFASGATVVFGTTPATNVIYVNATSLTATTPAGTAGPVTVTVTANSLSNGLANAFTYVAPAPTVSSIAPTTGPITGATPVTITGTNFASGATVTFGGVAATNVVVGSATSITATTPAHAAGAVNVVVTVSGQSGTLTNGFTYLAAPTVTSVSPNSGTTDGGNTVTITGTNFATGATVTFGGVAATGVVVTNSTTMTAVAPAWVGAAPTLSSISPTTGSTAGGTAVTLTGTNLTVGGAVTVAVTVSGQTGSLPNAYTYVAPAPTLTSITPTVGSTGGGTTVTIKGTNFS